MSFAWPKTPVGWWRLSLAVAAAALALVIVLQPPPWKVFAEAGEKIRLVDYLVAYSWIAAALNIALLGILAAICPWWANAPKPEPAPNAVLRRATPGWFWPVVLSAVLVCGLLTAPRLTQSLWDDEESSLLHSVLGRYVRRAPQGEVQLKEVPWRSTLFGYETPNNHIPYNALARISNSVWRGIARPEGLQFKEWALRLPAFLAGLATLVVLALLLRELGLPLAGALAAWLLALHPWFEKYCAEARGYTLATLLLYAALFFWLRGMRTGKWRWWALFALCQALCLWTWPGTLVFLALVNAGTVAAILLSKSTATPARTVLSRWFCCNALAAVALIQLMLPLVPQLRGYLDNAPKVNNGLAWLANTACYLATGAPWSAAQTRTPGRTEICPEFAAMPGLYIIALIAGALLLVLGIALSARRARWEMTIIMAAAAGAVALLIAAAQADMFVFSWYLLYLLPLLTTLIAVGLAASLVWLWRMPLGKVAAPIFSVLMFAVFLAVTQPARARGLHFSTEPVRESVLLTRPGFGPAKADADRTMTVGMTDPALCYDPDLFWARSARDLLLLCVQADRQNRPLWLNLGYPWSVREQQPLAQRVIDDPAFFTGHQTLLSEFPHCDRMVCRYVPGAASQADLSKYLPPEDVAWIKQHASTPPEMFFAK